ncbi:MAG: hypothetical protein HQM13_03150 [SAR324 cluster bacterium]|nr:hypothetical protein [SAR324 cluster bacterium]
MKKKSTYGMFAIALFSTAVLMGGCWGSSPEERSERISDAVADELKMNEEQTVQLKRSIGNLLEKGEELRDIRKTITEELVFQLRKDKVDEEHLNEVLAQNREKLESLLALFVNQFSTFHQSLTPEQRAQAAEKIENHKDSHHHRWGWHSRG